MWPNLFIKPLEESSVAQVNTIDLQLFRQLYYRLTMEVLRPNPDARKVVLICLLLPTQHIQLYEPPAPSNSRHFILSDWLT